MAMRQTELGTAQHTLTGHSQEALGSIVRDAHLEFAAQKASVTLLTEAVTL